MKSVAFAAVAITVSLTGCAPSAQVVQTWTDPSVTPQTFKQFKKILVIARLKDETSNRIAEDKMVAQFKPGEAVQGYSYLTLADTAESVVDARLSKDGFDGLIVIRLNNVKQSLNIDGGPYGGGRFYGGYSSVSVDENYYVITNVYSLTPSKLLWSATTSSLDPANVNTAMTGLVTALKAQLVKQGLIAPTPPAK